MEEGEGEGEEGGTCVDRRVYGMEGRWGEGDKGKGWRRREG